MKMPINGVVGKNYIKSRNCDSTICTISSTQSNNDSLHSYHLKNVTLEDSHVDGFLVSSSPYILDWQAKNNANYTFFKNSENHSQIENPRGNNEHFNSTNGSTIVQIPDGDLTTVTNAHFNISDSINKHSSKLIEKSKTGNLTETSNKYESSYSKTNDDQEEESDQIMVQSLKDLKNVPKKLEFSNLSDETFSSQRSAMNKHQKNRSNAALYELSLDDDTNETNNEPLVELDEDSDENDSDAFIENININYIKIKNQKLVTNVHMNSSKTYMPANKSAITRIAQTTSSSSVTWEISPKKKIKVSQHQPSSRLPLSNSNILNNAGYEGINLPLKSYKEFENFIRNSSSNFDINDLNKKKMQADSSIPQIKNVPSSKQLTVHNKENNGSSTVSNEVSCQTSFVVHNGNECQNEKLNIRRTSLAMKSKLKHLIEAQKHEKRSREFAELAKAERLHAERIKKLMIEMNDSTTSFNMSNYFQNATVDSNLFQTIVADEHECSQVEILNFDNKAKKPPPTVYVVKENQLSIKSSSSTSSLLPNIAKLKQTTELITNVDGAILSRPSDMYDKFKQKPNVSKAEPLFTAKANEAYTLSADNSGFGINSRLAKLSLQDAFKMFKANAIKQCERRQNELRERNEERRERAEFERQLVEMNLKAKEEEQKKLRESKRAGMLASQKSVKRVMSTKEIKELTKRNYERLPEVQEKMIKNKIEQAKKMNKLKSSIYNRTIQQHLLSKGPNFAMKFKAL